MVTKAAPLALSDCDKFSVTYPERCAGHLDHRCCGDCGKVYVRCKAHGGMAGAGRSLHSHRGLYHPVTAAT